MKINKQIKEVLQEINVPYKEGVTYLLSLYFKTVPNYIPENIAIPINIAKIVEMEDGVVSWRIPLFEGQETAFSWVIDEYIELFRSAGKNKFKRESVARMKKLFASNPDIRKEEVLGATRLYLRSVNDPKFVRNPHYFIEKGSGGSKTQDILTWIDLYREGQNAEAPTDNTRRLL